MHAATAFLALADSDQPMLLYWIIGGVIVLGPAIKAWIGVFEYFTGKRPDLSNFITRAEFAQARAERDAQLASTVTEIRGDLDRVEKLMTDLARDLPAIHRALGRLEGHDDAEKPRRPR